MAPLSSDCQWSFGAAGDNRRQDFRSFDTVWVNRGAAELRLINGTTVQLEAPLIMEMVSIDRARVLRGRVTVDVAKGAQGFVVDTAVARIVDHGTTFSVDVSDSSKTDVVVFQGEVEVNFMQHSDGAGAEGVGSTKRLRTGEAARVAEDGTLSRIVNVQRTDLSENRTHQSVVREVRDNFVREQTMKYYEIVPGGMHEDAVAFVDRDYQWNGIDGRGIPRYLMGGDYVKTFNDDKVTQNLVITVTFDRPAMLFLLVDDRLMDTDWLTEQFVDTGDDVGLDEGPHVPNDVRKLASGPGESIDQVHSIWKCRVSPGERISIGPYRPSVPAGSGQGTKTSLNMYGIVAVPLTADAEQ
ncbi:MAG: FecR family protein [Pirellulales bacterium]